VDHLDVDVVTEELDRLAQRVLIRAYEKVGKNGPLRIPQLEAIATRAFPKEWRHDRIAALRATLMTAISRLDGSFREITDQYAALILFNLAGAPLFPDIKPLDLEHVSQHWYATILRRLATECGLLNVSSTIRNDVKVLRRKLAATLVHPNFPFSATVVPSHNAGTMVVRSTLADEYVPRPAYERDIRQVRDAGEPHVWLWGDAGTGKTRLARAANRDRIAEVTVPVVSCEDEELLNAQLGKLAAKSGVAPTAINPGNRRLHFFEQLAKGKLPAVIVFDDAPVQAITDGSLVAELLAARGSFLIFTSIGAPPAGYHGPKLEVRGMTQAESEQMLRSRLPSISDSEVAMLDEALGGRPLAIEHSCAFLRRSGMRVPDFCQALVHEPAVTLDRAGKRFGRTLTQVYHLVLEQLGSSPEAVRALDLLVFSTDLMTLPLLAEIWVDGLELPAATPQGTEIDQDYMRSASLWCGAWTGVKFIDPTRLPRINPLDSVDLHEAVLQLEDTGLVRSDGDRLVMHQLTRAILRALRDDQADNIYQRIRQTVYDTVRAENWKGGDALSATRLWWAPQLRIALARAMRTIPDLSQVSLDDVVRLATLAAVMMRAHRQLGIDPTIVMDDAARAAVAASIRLHITADSDPDKDALRTAYRTVHTESLEFLILVRGFDRGVDAFPRLGEEPTPEQQWVANTIRLKHATEWDLARHYLTTGEQQAREHNTIGWRLGTTGERATLQGVRRSADDAITMATLYYDQARWSAAIEALEHAYSCYLQIGASVEAIRGAIDAGRRLARVHLRAGHLNDAAAWLDRIVREVYQQRSECTFNGKPSPFKLIDRLLEAQVQQARAELEMTALVLELDKPDTEITLEIIATVLQPRYERARHAVDLVRALRANRLVPEFSMHALRLQLLTNRVEGIDALTPQFDHDKEPYQAALAQLQVHTLVTPFMATMLSETEFDTYRQTVPAGQVEFAEQVRAARDQMGNQLVELAQEVGVTHGNPYWHVRGVCAAAILATAADADPAWAVSLRDTAKEGARNIGRTDWAEKIDGLWDTNGGLWLLGY
jgi:hypothetical protein